MSETPQPNATRLIIRLHALLEGLRSGSASLGELITRLGAAYPGGESARRMLDRDIQHLAALGILVERETNPLRYTLRGGTPIFASEELRVLGLIRDTFDSRHPQAQQIHNLLERLTNNLTDAEQRHYTKRASRRAPLRPAIDYTPYGELIDELEQAISVRQPMRFSYRALDRSNRLHSYVQPYEIEFYDRHFYLVAHTALSNQILDFRIDRIHSLQGSDLRLPPNTEHSRPLISFRYRLAAILTQGEISQRFEEQQIVERMPNGDVIIEAKGRSDFFIIQTLLRYRSNAELLDPPWLRERMQHEVQALYQLYHRDEA